MKHDLFHIPLGRWCLINRVVSIEVLSKTKDDNPLRLTNQWSSHCQAEWGNIWGKSFHDDEMIYGKIEGVANFTFAQAAYLENVSVDGYNTKEVRENIFDYYTTPFYSTLNAQYIDVTYTYQKMAFVH